MEQVYYFEVTPPTQPAEAIAKSIVTVADKDMIRTKY
jgi:hypothetical protein